MSLPTLLRLRRAGTSAAPAPVRPRANYAPPSSPQLPTASPSTASPSTASPSMLPPATHLRGYGSPAIRRTFRRQRLPRLCPRTAGIVGAGALAFEGVESLMHGFGEHAGYGGGSGFGGMGGMSGGPREEVINNYYGDSPEHGHEQHGLSSDIEDRRDDRSVDVTADDDRASFADPGSSDTSSARPSRQLKRRRSLRRQQLRRFRQLRRFKLRL